MLQASLRRGGRTSLSVAARRGGLILSSSSTSASSSSSNTVAANKGYATSAAAGPAAASQTPIHSTPSAGAAARQSGLPSLGSIEASWMTLPRGEQERIYNELQELQKKDWKELSLDQKKAAYYIAYGPHGPRAPIVPPNTNGKVFVGTIACIVAAGGVFALVRANSQETPKTLTKEWKEAQNEYARSQKMDPFTGASRADGKGKSFTA